MPYQEFLLYEKHFLNDIAKGLIADESVFRKGVLSEFDRFCTKGKESFFIALDAVIELYGNEYLPMAHKLFDIMMVGRSLEPYKSGTREESTAIYYKTVAEKVRDELSSGTGQHLCRG